jgi:hypothetical protein
LSAQAPPALTPLLITDGERITQAQRDSDADDYGFIPVSGASAEGFAALNYAHISAWCLAAPPVQSLAAYPRVYYHPTDPAIQLLANDPDDALRQGIDVDWRDTPLP